jgi:hypothetical protein
VEEGRRKIVVRIVVCAMKRRPVAGAEVGMRVKGKEKVPCGASQRKERGEPEPLMEAYSEAR